MNVKGEMQMAGARMEGHVWNFGSYDPWTS